MAIATFSPAYAPLRGKIGGLVFKHYRDKVVVTRAPVFTKPWSPAQQAGRNRFAEASAYARTVQADPLLRAKYAKISARRGLTIRSAAISAFLKGETELVETPTKPRQHPPPRPRHNPRIRNRPLHQAACSGESCARPRQGRTLPQPNGLGCPLPVRERCVGPPALISDELNDFVPNEAPIAADSRPADSSICAEQKACRSVCFP